MKALLGGKGANLAEMVNLGLPVPPGFTITTEACNEYYEQNQQLPVGLDEEVHKNLATVEQMAGKKFNDKSDPLLVSVRSGAMFSMPGMMDTILNLGLNSLTVEGLAATTANPRFAYDSYRRFIQMFSDVVLEIPKAKFEELLEAAKHEKNVKFDQDMGAEDWKNLIVKYKALVKAECGRDFPEDPVEQLFMAIQAVFRSWNNDRAIVYRNLNKIDHHLGTAVNVQIMVFGNMGDDSGTGVAFSRSPSTGEKDLYGEYLINAQGEDVVAGIRTPQTIDRLKEDMPAVYEDFARIVSTLENHYKDMQDMEFTIERGRLYMLQTRNGKRTAQAAVKAAYDFVAEGMLSKKEAIERLDPAQIEQLLHRQIDPAAKLHVLAKGLPASPGAATGQIVFTADEAAELGKQGHKVLLVRNETTPDDIHGIIEAQGVLTSRGGMTSHAAVVARGMGKPCVSGCEAARINFAEKTLTIESAVFKEGDFLSIDGATGRVIKGEIPLIEPTISEEFSAILNWADEIKHLGVRANADTAEDAAKARELGAEGIGLTRTEHMFMAADRLPFVQEMIMAEDTASREAALQKLLPMQEADFYGILKAMQGYPVCIRLLDPPLHEFLPSAEELLVEITTLKITKENPALLAEKEKLFAKVKSLHEANPMLGHRGCRLGLTYPEIYEMQMTAIFNATARLTKEGIDVHPEVEIPLTLSRDEMAFFKTRIDRIAKETADKTGAKFHYTSGTMIELPRAALLAGELADAADFFSFGTNDLTQTTLGFSRDDAESKFLPAYLEQKIFPENPFVQIDRKGVGRLMQIAVEEGRQRKKNLLVGICGEHGGNPSSVEFCHQIGLDFVSCSPFRVPIARLSAAQAAIKDAKTPFQRVKYSTT